MRKKLLLILLVCCPFLGAYAWTFDGTDATSTHGAQLRLGAEFTKKWRTGLALHFEEDLRFTMVGSTYTSSTASSAIAGPTFDKSYTSVSLSYKNPQFKYLKLDAGYALKLMNKDTLAINKIMRHRVFMSLTGSYRVNQWSFSLRERVLTEIRMGELDYYTAAGCYQNNRAEWQLRSKFEVAYHALSKPLKPYLWCELINTLNANELQQKYANNDPTQKGHQYISNVRAGIGLTYKINRQNALDFFYRFDYSYDRDVNVKPNKQTVYLTEETAYMHSIGIAYNFDW